MHGIPNRLEHGITAMSCPVATFRASDMEAISDFRLHLQMVFAHILTGAPKGGVHMKQIYILVIGAHLET